MLARLSGRRVISLFPPVGVWGHDGRSLLTYYCCTVPVPYRLERDLRGTVPRATRPGRDRDGRAKKRLFFTKKKENQPQELKKKINPSSQK